MNSSGWMTRVAALAAATVIFGNANNFGIGRPLFAEAQQTSSSSEGAYKVYMKGII